MCNGCGKRHSLALANEPEGPSDPEHDLPHATDHCPICADHVGFVLFIGTSRKAEEDYTGKKSYANDARIRDRGRIRGSVQKPTTEYEWVLLQKLINQRKNYELIAR
jgi:hypothetical protein